LEVHDLETTKDSDAAKLTDQLGGEREIATYFAVSTPKYGYGLAFQKRVYSS